MKLERKALAHYLDASFGGSGSPAWFLIGKDIEEMSVELNPDVSTAKNILGDNTVIHNGYEPSMDADPYYANPEDTIYPKLLDIAMNRKQGDSCLTKVLEVVIEDTTASKHKAWMQDAMVAPNSYGGDTAGFAIPFTLSFTGQRTEGYVTLVDRVPTFTAGAIPPAAPASNSK